MSGMTTALVCIGVLAVGGIAVYAIAKSTKAPVTALIQAPSPAVAGIQALGQLASKGIDAYIQAKLSKDSDDS
jgi:uncharacterized protein (UPF0333 family)